MPENSLTPPPATEPAPEAPAVTPGSPGRTVLLVACGCLFLLIVAVGIKWSGEHRASAECRAQLERLWSAARGEAEANDGRLPSGSQAIEGLVFRHLHHQRYWSCPRTTVRYLWTSRERRLGDDPRWLLAWEVRPHGWPLERHRALFIDGRIGELTGAELKELLAREKREPPPKPQRVDPRPELREDPEAPPPGYRQPSKTKAGPEKIPAPPQAPAEPSPATNN